MLKITIFVELKKLIDVKQFFNEERPHYNCVLVAKCGDIPEHLLFDNPFHASIAWEMTHNDYESKFPKWDKKGSKYQKVQNMLFKKGIKVELKDKIIKKYWEIQGV